ncbi:hypothetical protein [Geobacter sulfurreducens]|uniref:hypothetical protein n=1 Tax=Geobacter sulfurreducens TaxID=35554 RepID=UPI000DBAFA8C|nr:hypothetical protein [Geobacter sulfurreducens]BBA71019.1 hypothetical protein YM18_2501 [Geobacter sulfurreducens]
MDFGFLKEDICYETEDFRIAPLPDIWERVESLSSTGLISEGWFYPPIEEPRGGHEDPVEFPKVPWRAFNLLPSHQVNLKRDCKNTKREEFIVNILGFIKGVKLIPSDWCHFYRVQIEPNRSIGFHCTEDEIVEVISKADKFFITQKPETVKIFFGAVHWFLFSESYYHDFERFDCHYKVLDACYKLCRDTLEMKKCTHPERPVEMAKYFDMPVPSWAKLEGAKSKLSILRNQFYHEALFAGEPIGFNMPDPCLVFQLKNFNAKLLLSIIGIKAEYIKYPVDQEFCLHSLGMTKS